MPSRTTFQTLRRPVGMGIPAIVAPGARESAGLSASGSVATSIKGLRRVVIVIGSGKKLEVAVSGDRLFVQTATTDNGNTVNVTATTDQGSTLLIEPDTLLTAFGFESPFTVLSFDNQSGGQATIVAYIGFGDIRMDAPNMGVMSFLPSGLGQFGFARPNNVTPYAANQVMGGAADSLISVAGMVRTNGGRAVITKAIAQKNSVTVANCSVRLWLFQSVPGAAIPDQGAYPHVQGNVSMGWIDFPVFETGGAGSDSATCVLDGLSVPFDLNVAAGGLASCVLLARPMAQAAYVPTANEVWIFNLFTEPY